MLTREDHKTYEQILREELTPAFGCTEPIALAYCAAKAREVLGQMPTEVIIEASGNIIKNVKSVIVPNTGGMKGIPRQRQLESWQEIQKHVLRLSQR